jgi:hypothetical protein
MLHISNSYAKIDGIWEHDGNNGGKFKTFSMSSSSKGKEGSDTREYSSWNAIMVKNAKEKQDELVKGSRIKIVEGGAKSIAPKGDDGKWAKDEKGKYKPAQVTVIVFEYELQEDTRQNQAVSNESGNEESAF